MGIFDVCSGLCSICRFFLAIIPPSVITWYEYDPIHAIGIFIVACIINELAENILFPQMAGNTFQLSQAIIFISLLFWGFILGGSGIIVAVPLTAFVYTLLNSSEDTRWVAELMNSDKDD